MPRVKEISSDEEEDIWDYRSQSQKINKVSATQQDRRYSSAISKSKAEKTSSTQQLRKSCPAVPTKLLSNPKVSVFKNDTVKTETISSPPDTCSTVTHKTKKISSQTKTGRSKTKKTEKKKMKVKTEVKAEATPDSKKNVDRSGRCPVCQMPFILLSLIETPSWHIDQCLEVPYSSKNECSLGLQCSSEIPSHYKKFRHTQLARSRRKNQLSGREIGNIENAKTKLSFEVGDSRTVLRVPGSSADCLVKQATSPVLDERSNPDVIDDVILITSDSDASIAATPTQKKLHCSNSNKERRTSQSSTKTQAVSSQRPVYTKGKGSLSSQMISESLESDESDLEELILDKDSTVKFNYLNTRDFDEFEDDSGEKNNETITKVNTVDLLDESSNSVQDINDLVDESRSITDMINDVLKSDEEGKTADNEGESKNYTEDIFEVETSNHLTEQTESDCGSDDILTAKPVSKRIPSAIPRLSNEKSDSPESDTSSDWDILKTTLTQPQFDIRCSEDVPSERNTGNENVVSVTVQEAGSYFPDTLKTAVKDTTHTIVPVISDTAFQSKCTTGNVTEQILSHRKGFFAAKLKQNELKRNLLQNEVMGNVDLSERDEQAFQREVKKTSRSELEKQTFQSTLKRKIGQSEVNKQTFQSEFNTKGQSELEKKTFQNEFKRKVGQNEFKNKAEEENVTVRKGQGSKAVCIVDNLFEDSDDDKDEDQTVPERAVRSSPRLKKQKEQGNRTVVSSEKNSLMASPAKKKSRTSPRRPYLGLLKVNESRSVNMVKEPEKDNTVAVPKDQRENIDRNVGKQSLPLKRKLSDDSRKVGEAKKSGIDQKFREKPSRQKETEILKKKLKIENVPKDGFEKKPPSKSEKDIDVGKDAKKKTNVPKDGFEKKLSSKSKKDNDVGKDAKKKTVESFFKPECKKTEDVTFIIQTDSDSSGDCERFNKVGQLAKCCDNCAEGKKCYQKYLSKLEEDCSQAKKESQKSRENQQDLFHSKHQCSCNSGANSQAISCPKCSNVPRQTATCPGNSQTNANLSCIRNHTCSTSAGNVHVNKQSNCNMNSSCNQSQTGVRPICCCNAAAQTCSQQHHYHCCHHCHCISNTQCVHCSNCVHHVCSSSQVCSSVNNNSQSSVHTPNLHIEDVCTLSQNTFTNLGGGFIPESEDVIDDCDNVINDNVHASVCDTNAVQSTSSANHAVNETRNLGSIRASTSGNLANICQTVNDTGDAGLNLGRSPHPAAVSPKAEVKLVTQIRKSAMDILMASSHLLYGKTKSANGSSQNAIGRGKVVNRAGGSAAAIKVAVQSKSLKDESSGKVEGEATDLPKSVGRGLRKERNSGSTDSSQASFSGQQRQCPFYKKIPGTHFTVDAFRYGDIPDCRGYILSHFHYDHYGGLTRQFKNPIYCSKITGNLVKKKLGVEAQYIHMIPLDTPTVIDNVQVTFLDANHCPGSVLILFRLRTGKVYLHTGDFRACQDMELYPELLNLTVHSLFLDTTYCDPQYDFPPQDEVISFTVQLAKDALTMNPKTLIVCGSYTIGKERIFTAIARDLDCKICVTRDKKSVLDCLEDADLARRVSLQWEDSGLHVLPMNKLNYQGLQEHLLLNGKKYNSVLGIEPTGWTHKKSTLSLHHIKPKINKDNIKVYGIPYSEHSSFLELKRFVQFIKPEKILPTVNNGNVHSRRKMEVIFAAWLEEVRCGLMPVSREKQSSISGWVK